jgi:hypothetical protein
MYLLGMFDPRPDRLRAGPEPGPLRIGFIECFSQN